MAKLSERINATLEVDENDEYGLAAAQLLSLQRAAQHDSVTPFAWSSNTATLDLSQAKNFAASDTLTGNGTITLINGQDGMHGVIQVQKDATGTAHTLAFTIAERTQVRDLNVPDLNPLETASSITEYHYYFFTLNGTAYCRIFKVFLQ